MRSPGIQLPLPVRLDDSLSFDNFYLPDEQLQLLTEALKNASGEVFFIYGAAYSGVTHLLTATCALAGHPNSQYVPMADALEMDPGTLDGLPLGGLLAFDDVHLAAGKQAWELSLFNLFNRQQEAGGSLVYGSHEAPAGLQFALADLRSRLLSGQVWQVPLMREEDRAKALQFRALRRGVVLGDNATQYLLTRGSRDMQTLILVLGKLDLLSLSQKKKVTLNLVMQLLEEGVVDDTVR